MFSCRYSKACSVELETYRIHHKLVPYILPKTVDFKSSSDCLDPLTCQSHMTEQLASNAPAAVEGN